MTRLAIVMSIIATACLQAGTVYAESIVVSDGWVRASIGGASNSAAYMVLTTEEDAPDRLTAVQTPVAERAELHNHIMEDGIARMRQVEAIDVIPGEPMILEPGGLHVMLIGLKEKLEPGAKLPLTLSFEQAGDIEIELTVHSMNHRPKSHEHGKN
ncbi:MAG: copper chaperone PCu(A)C [Geminicoccaceae bacterium]